jgi:hypothetical protein
MKRDWVFEPRRGASRCLAWPAKNQNLKQKKQETATKRTLTATLLGTRQGPDIQPAELEA